LNYYGNTKEFEEVGQMDWPGSSAPKNIPECGAYVCPEAEEVLNDNSKLSITKRI